MRKSVIPWHVFQEATDSLNPFSLNLWLQRWQFMDAGVMLFDRNISVLELPRTILNLLRENSEIDECKAGDEILQVNSIH